jgi:hypothetical protein
MRFSLIRDVAQRRLVGSYGRFGTTYLSCVYIFVWQTEWRMILGRIVAVIWMLDILREFEEWVYGAWMYNSTCS